MSTYEELRKEYDEKRKRERDQKARESAQRTRTSYEVFAAAVQATAPGDEVEQARLLAGLGVDYLFDQIEEYTGEYHAKAAREALGSAFPWLEKAMEEARQLMDEQEEQ